MIIKPKKKKKSDPVKDVKVYVQGGRIVISGAGFFNLRRTMPMTAPNDKSTCYLIDNNEGFQVQFTNTTWSVSIDADDTNANELVEFIDNPNIKTRREIYTTRDGRQEYAVCLHAGCYDYSNAPQLTSEQWNALIGTIEKMKITGGSCNNA